MSTYLVTFNKQIPVIQNVGGGLTARIDPWETTINAENMEQATRAAKSLGALLRVRLAKGYDIVLDGVTFVY